MTNDYLLFVGTYTKGESKGIYVCPYDSRSGAAGSLGVAAETKNPTFLTVDPARKFLYAVNELSNHAGASSGAITAFVIDHATGRLSQVNQIASRGADPCYIAFDRTGKYAMAANYSGGSVAVFPVRKDGGLGDATAFVQHAGTGHNSELARQPRAHCIETTPDNRFAIVADLGLDQLLIYRFDASKGTLTPHNPPFTKLGAGAGPRHLAFHRDRKLVYVINELASTVTGLSYDSEAGTLWPLQTISTLPAEFREVNATAQIRIHPNGKFLYASNRGHDSIAVFSIDPRSGALEPVDHVSTHGKKPRNFEFDPSGTRLLVANQNSDNIAVFRIDTETGRLTFTGQMLHVPCPAAIRFVPTS